MNKTKLIQVRTTEEERDRFHDACQQLETRVSDVVLAALRRVVKRAERAKNK